MKIVVENTVCLNTGDAAILFGIQKVLETAFGQAISIQVFDSQPDVAARLYPKENYPSLSFHHVLSESLLKYRYDDNGFKNALKPIYNRLVFEGLRYFGVNGAVNSRLFSKKDRDSLLLYRDADLLITTGGTYLVETYSLEKRINQFKIDELISRVPIFFTQSLGPFRNADNREKLKPIFDQSPLILLRDSYSKDNLDDLIDDPQKCHVVADVVFALAETQRITDILSGGSEPLSGRVAISVRHWNYVKDGEEGMDRYTDSICEIATDLVKLHDKEVVFLSTCQGVEEYEHDDSKTAKAIVAKLAPDVAARVSVDDRFHTPAELMDQVKGYDFVVATRMHMMIMSLCVGTPVLPIAYEFKTRELAKRIGVSDLLLDIDTVTPAQARQSLAALVANLDHYRTVSLQSVLDEHISAMSAAPLVKAAASTLSAPAADRLLPGGGKNAA